MPNFVPCSRHHHCCSRAHSDLVWSYRAERHRQEIDWERRYGGYAADQQHARATGASMITFGQWLQAHRIRRAA